MWSSCNLAEYLVIMFSCHYEYVILIIDWKIHRKLEDIYIVYKSFFPLEIFVAFYFFSFAQNLFQRIIKVLINNHWFVCFFFYTYLDLSYKIDWQHFVHNYREYRILYSTFASELSLLVLLTYYWLILINLYLFLFKYWLTRIK